MKARKRSLRNFSRLQTQSQCPVCNLPENLLKQIDGRNKRAHTVPLVLAWLREEWDITITEQQYEFHAKGRHDARNVK